jgi:glutathione S-transferase
MHVMPHIKLIGVGASRVMRTLWMLEELRTNGSALAGVAYEHDPISYTDDALRAPPYTTLNPNGRIPILVVDGFAVYESLAINLYLADKFASPLSLTTPEERAVGNQFAMWSLTEVEQAVFDWAIHTVIKPEAERDAAVAAAAWDKLQRPFDALEASLQGKTYLVGERFTVADLNTASVMYRSLKMDLSAWPAVNAWLQRCWSREAAKVPRRVRGEAV